MEMATFNFTNRVLVVYLVGGRIMRKKDKMNHHKNIESQVRYDPQKQIHVPDCFGCSPKNPIGLKIAFAVKDDAVIGEFTPNKYHMGPPDALHGGIIATLIDESISYFARTVIKHDIRTMKEEIVFRNQSPIGETAYVEARLKEEKSRALIMTAKVYSKDNIIAEATGTLYKIKK
jgi:acyl-coenzyme A thioesterase PaaI-like protein